MKKFLLSALFAAALVAPQTMLAQKTYMGYTTAEFNRNKGQGFSTTSKTHGVAIHLSAAKAAELKGARVVGLRFANSTRMLLDMNIFATRKLGDAPLRQTAVSGASTSLKDYMFDSPIEIDGSELFFGYTAKLNNTNMPPLLFDGTSNFAAGVAYGYADGSWIDVSQKGVGAPVLQLVVEGAPELTDVVMKPFSVDGFFKVNNTYSIGAEIFNFGTKPITSLVVTSRLGDEGEKTHTIDGLNILPNSAYNFKLDNIKPTKEGKAEVSLAVSSVNGGADMDATDNVSSASTYFYPEGMKKKILIEKFTGQACGNCPRGDREIEETTKGREEDFVEVCHHTYLNGATADLFAMMESFYVGQFYYNSNNSYAPAAMVNRAPWKEGLSTVVFGDSPQGLTEGLVPGIALQDKTEPYVNVGMVNNYDATTRKGEVTVKVFTYNMPSNAQHSLNVYLTQDGVMGYQSSAGSNYVHNHALRQALTGNFGAAINLKEGEWVEKSYSYELPDTIVSTYSHGKVKAVAENMNIVAFVGDYTGDCLTSVVYNCNSLPLVTNGATAGVGQAPMVDREWAKPIVLNGQVSILGHYNRAEIYDLSGKRVAALVGDTSVPLAKGVYVVRIDGRSTKVLMK